MLEQMIFATLIFLLGLTIKNTRDIGILCGKMKNV